MFRLKADSSLVLLLFISVSSLVFASETLHSGWEKVKTEDGIDVFSKKVMNSDLIAFKGVTTFKASPEDLMRIFRDDKKWKNWIEMFEDGSFLEVSEAAGGPDGNEYVTYQSYKMPLFISNRDLVIRSKVKKLENPLRWEIQNRSVEHPKAPETVGIRIEVRFSHWILEPLKTSAPGQMETRASLEVHSDPKGYIPSWLINFMQKDYVIKLFNNLKKVLEENHS